MSKTPFEVIAELLDEEAARGILAALEKEGYVVVPREPTDEMWQAGEKEIDDSQHSAEASMIWRRMIEARHGISHPQQPYTPEPGEED